MNKQKRFLLLLAIAAGLLGSVFILSRSSSDPENSGQNISREQKASLSLELSGQKERFDVSKYVGKTALEATLESVDAEVQGSGENAFVVSIAGKKVDSQKKEFWELVINGQSAQVGAGSYIIMSGDSLEWKLSTY